jgi:hypothetical protein
MVMYIAIAAASIAVFGNEDDEDGEKEGERNSSW